MASKRRIFRFEGKLDPVSPLPAFAKRLGRSAAISLGIVLVSLFGGICGYHFLEELSWVDSFLNAAMILAGMGPVDAMKTNGGKVFAGCYALYSGLVVIAAVGVILAPVVHRMLHKFHAKQEERANHKPTA